MALLVSHFGFGSPTKKGRTDMLIRVTISTVSYCIDCPKKKDTFMDLPKSGDLKLFRPRTKKTVIL